MKAAAQVVFALATLLSGSSAVPAAAADQGAEQAIPARWVTRELDFVYMGFTVLYSCDGLQDQMKQLLLQLGARDLVIRSNGCSNLSGPETMPGVRATFSVLAPAASQDKGAPAGETVPARWESVTIDADSLRKRNAGACELVEQLHRQVVPLFTTRSVHFRSGCFPYTATLAGAHLALEVLRPAGPPATDQK